MAVSDLYIEDVDPTASDANKIGWDGAKVRRIYMQGVDLKYNVGVFTQTGETPGQPSTRSFEDSLSYGDHIGFENPQITIQGVIDLNSFVDGNGPTIVVGVDTHDIINVKLLQRIYKSGHVFKITDQFDDSTTPPIYRLQSLDDSTTTISPTTINVMCKSVSFIANTQVKEGSKITYTITFVEVKT